MTRQVANFNPGPACLPEEVLKEAGAELLDFAGTGLSVLESSHRAPEYDAVHTETQKLFLELLGLGDNYKVLFFGGGATTQFALIPMNFLAKDKSADYLVTGTWSQKAVKQAEFYGTARVAGTGERDGKFVCVPKTADCDFDDDAAYVHLTSNNTIAGTQYHAFPDTKAPLIGDMSSDILSYKFDATKFAMIYAGAQKNLGPAGVTAVIIREDMLQRCPELPVMFHYPTQAAKRSMSNTPPCFPIYMVGKTLRWIKDAGGLEAIEKQNDRKAGLIYDTIDSNPDFFRSPVDEDSRSKMNIVFRLPTEEHEQRFIAEAKDNKMLGVKGHRSVGGCRLSVYNACPMEWVERVTDFMKSFAKK